jgi:fimbrial isopeptide formation D2 family protein/LPXTG-motif cell wall-anchored protein
MKTLRKMMALALAMVMVLGMTTMVFAAGEGTLTVKNSEADVTYNFYKIFDLTGQDTSDPADNLYDAVVYTIDSDWTAFFNGDGASYIVDTNTGDLNPIKINGTTKYINITESNKVAFTNAAMKYAIDNNLSTDKTATGVASGDVTVSGLDLGYYLMVPVDQTDEKTNPLNTTGTIASLTSTIPTADIYVKATKPTVEKTDNTVSADIGQTVNYELKGKVPNTSGTASFTYQLKDTLSSGLTLNHDVAITIGGTAVAAATAESWISYETNGFTITVPVVDYQANKGEDIVVTYTAVVNANAIQSTNEKNSATVKYGRNPDQLQESTPVEEELYSANIIINKYTGNDATNGTKLPDAVFALMKIDGGTAKYYKYTAASGTTPASVSWVEVSGAPTSGTATVTDAMATALANAGTAGTITTKTTDADGAASFDGIADGTYYLVEIAAPEGYNRLDAPQAVTVTGTDVDNTTDHLENTAYAGQTTFDEAVNAQADVNNATGTALPSTGGIGTTIFYVIGAILVLGAGILLVTRRRMNAN